jgi:hypothetical protein
MLRTIHPNVFPFLASSSDAPRRLSLGRMVNQSTALLMGAIGALILILAVLILFHENRNATKGYRLRGLERERSVLLLEQEVLNMQIAESQALERIKNDPQIAAMPTAKKVQYTTKERVAMKQTK